MSAQNEILEVFQENLTMNPARIRELLPEKVPVSEIKKVLAENSETFQKNQKIERVQRYRQYQTYHVGEILQCDLMFLNSPRNTNQKILLEKGKFLYALVAIDTHTRYLQVIPLKTKGSIEVAQAIAKAVNFLRDAYYGGLKHYRFKILADDGREFSQERISAAVSNVELLRSKSKHGASIAERAILEVRNKIRLLKGLQGNTTAQVNLSLAELEKVVKVINDAPKASVSHDKHSATEMLFGWDKAPDKLIQVYPEIEGEAAFKLPLGGYCRIVNYSEKDGRVFVKKSAYNNYTSKIFSIAERSLDGIQNIPIYTLVSLDGNYRLETTWYEEELLHVPTSFVAALSNEERDEHENFSQEEIKTFRIFPLESV